MPSPLDPPMAALLGLGERYPTPASRVAMSLADLGHEPWAAVTDPYMMAAMRQRHAVQPLGGRREGRLTRGAGALRDNIAAAPAPPTIPAHTAWSRPARVSCPRPGRPSGGPGQRISTRGIPRYPPGRKRSVRTAVSHGGYAWTCPIDREGPARVESPRRASAARHPPASSRSVDPDPRRLGLASSGPCLDCARGPSSL